MIYTVDAQELQKTLNKLKRQICCLRARGTSSAMVAGTTTVNTSRVAVDSVILVSHRTAGGTLGHLSIGTIVDGTSFVINSSSNTDTSTIDWVIYN